MVGIKNFRHTGSLGFTVVEILIVVVIIGILAAITYSTLTNSPDKVRLARANSELTTLANAVNLYRAKTNLYPPDTTEAGLPSVINAYIADYNNSWPAGPWPGSLYDFEAWRVDTANTPAGSIDTVQVSLRFCTYQQFLDNGSSFCANNAKATHQSWANSFTSNNNAYYYCITGYCRSNQSSALSTPGYCVNCPNNAAIAKPGGG
jgi:prepilin-type N-terminal cleavage/methylation domain-containing protein